jgi:hypothetical protein
MHTPKDISHENLDFNSKVEREGIFKLTIRNESSCEISDDNWVRVANFTTTKNLDVKSKMVPCCNI